MIDIAERADDQGSHVHADLETLAIACYVKVDDVLNVHPELRNPARRAASPRS
jgi:hypothetical protein